MARRLMTSSHPLRISLEQAQQVAAQMREDKLAAAREDAVRERREQEGAGAVSKEDRNEFIRRQQAERRATQQKTQKTQKQQRVKAEAQRLREQRRCGR